jgi:hypothetical protein
VKKGHGGTSVRRRGKEKHRKQTPEMLERLQKLGEEAAQEARSRAFRPAWGSRAGYGLGKA